MNSTPDTPLHYEKYTLDNGLDVVLHRDTSAPVVSVAIQYHVGSNRERAGKTGFAHFFEHMLFQRSEHLPRNAFFQKIEELGGTFNGGTSNDGTIYYETVPRDALEKILWMESDRMGYFIHTVTEGGLRREIDVVSNEKRQMENVPYGLAFDLMFKHLFPQGHPYSWTVIGEIEDLRSATVEEVQAFYDRYYTPNNATLALAGDFDPEQIRPLIEHYFGEIPSRPRPTPPPIQPIRLQAPRRISYEDGFCDAPMLLRAYPGVEMYHPDGYALDFLTNLLAADKKSPLYKVVVEERGLAPEVDFFHYQLELAGVLVLEIKPYPGVHLDEVEAAIEEAFTRFEQMELQPEDLERYVAMEQMRTYSRLTTTNGKAQALARDNVFGGLPDCSLREIESYRQVTREEIRRVYTQYLQHKPYLCESIFPQGAAELAVSDSELIFPPREPITEQTMNATAGEIIDDPYELTPTRWDRTREPALMANTPQLKVPPIWSLTLANGMQVQGIAYEELPLSYFSIELADGMVADPIHKVGVANLLAQLLMEGTARRTPEALEEELGRLGAQINLNGGRESLSLSCTVLTRNLKEVMALVGEMITEPRWDAQRFAVLKERTLDDLRQRRIDPRSIASDLLNRALFGSDSILSFPAAGTLSTVNAITLEDLQGYYQAHLAPQRARMSFVGGEDAASMRDLLTPLCTAWAQREYTPLTLPANTHTPSHRCYFVDYPEARQSYLLFGSKAMAASDPSAYPALIVNDHLGDSSGSLLFEELRLKHGYTYGAYSGFGQNNWINTFQAWASVQATVTRESLQLFREILTCYPAQYHASALETSREGMRRTMYGSLESPLSRLNMLRAIALYGLPADYLQQRAAQLDTFTLAQAKETIQRHLDFEQMILVVVGDGRTQRKEVASLDWGSMQCLSLDAIE
ncbi:MAG: pitrilysin family protein [Alistipes sp.]|nr:pitrilysin family protein [Alistipes sp.]